MVVTIFAIMVVGMIVVMMFVRVNLLLRVRMAVRMIMSMAVAGRRRPHTRVLCATGGWVSTTNLADHNVLVGAGMYRRHQQVVENRRLHFID